jgi:hypothetical protein
MDTIGFKTYLQNATYIKEGKEVLHKKTAIDKRIREAQELEECLHIDLDDYVESKEKFTELLIRVRAAEIEDLRRIHKSNAARHYYSYKNGGVKFGRIFYSQKYTEV